jgi:hypothetical protein
VASPLSTPAFLGRVSKTNTRKDHRPTAVAESPPSPGGNLANGDEIEADGLYSGIFTLPDPSAGSAGYRVEVGRAAGSAPARSELRNVLVTEHLDLRAFSAA